MKACAAGEAGVVRTGRQECGHRFRRLQFRRDRQRHGDAVFLNTGQVCLCAERVYVERPMFERFVSALKKKAESYNAGWPTDKATNLGPLISANIARRCCRTMRSHAKKERRLSPAVTSQTSATPAIMAAYVQPTILTGLTRVGALREGRDLRAGLSRRAVRFGRRSGGDGQRHEVRTRGFVWTSDLKRAHRVARQMNVGITWVNCWFLRDLRTPFGGVGLSGIGREGGMHSLNFYSELNNICIKI